MPRDHKGLKDLLETMVQIVQLQVLKALLVLKDLLELQERLGLKAHRVLLVVMVRMVQIAL